MNTPTVSIVMAAYNAEQWIAQAIESVLAQTVSDWELIVVDDNSTDRTGDIVQAIDDPRIVYRRVAPIRHPAGVRNAGAALARGRYLMFLDADDAYWSNALEVLLGALQQQPAAFAAYGFCNHIGGKGLHADSLVRTPGGNLALPPGYAHDWRRLLCSDFPCLLPALIIEKAMFEQLGRFNERYYSADDFEFYLRMFFHDRAGVVCVPAYIYRYRLHAAGITKTEEHTYRILNSALDVVDWALTDARLPESARALASLAHVRRWHYLARERLLQSRPAVCRQIAWKARTDPQIGFGDWLRWCGPLILRTLLPASLDGMLLRARAARRARRHEQLISTPAVKF